MSREKQVKRLLSVATVGIVAFMCNVARATDYMISASGPVNTIDSFSSTFDGTNHGTLPSILNGDQLAGGTFRATYYFTPTKPTDITAHEAYYDLSGTSARMTYDLLDASGNVVHHGSNSSLPEAIIADNTGGAPFIVDQALLDAWINDISNANFFTPIYTPPGELFSVADFNVFGYVDDNTNYLTGLDIPTDPAIYLGFPEHIFDVIVALGDGDYNNRVGPYQYAETDLTYNITSMTITVVPEPSIAIAASVIAIVALVRPTRQRCSLRRALQA